jgi:hypothetical protein
MGEIPIFLATGNSKKADRVISLGIKTTSPFFDESNIKTRVNRNLGLQYPVAISRMKLEEHLRREGDNRHIIIVSDSVIAVEGNNGLIPVNRDDDPNFITQINLELKNGQPIYFLGAVSFGNYNGPPYTLLTYFKINPGPNKQLQIPIDIDRLTDDYSRFEFGIVDGAGKFIPEGENDFASGRPYISGLTPHFIDLAKEYGNIFPLIDLLQNQISTFPFNTIVFYELVNQGWTYDQIVANWQNIFQENGGNCSFHSLYFAQMVRQRGFEPKIALFPSKNPDHEQGHSAVMVGKFLFDPGLSLPYPIAWGLQPIEFINGKNAFLNQDGLTVNKNGKDVLFPLRELIDVEEYLGRLSKILSALHSRRTIVKIDYHDRDGKVIKRQSFP